MVAALLWWFLARDVKSTGATERTSIVEVFKGLISIRNVQLILIMGFLSFAIGHGFNDWLPKILEAGGLPPAVAGFAASIPLLVGVLTVLVVPRLVTPILRGRIIALASLVVAIALFIIAKASGVSLIIGLALYGLSFCCVLPLLMLLLMDIPEVGSRYMGSAAGIFFGIGEMGGFVGLLIIGAIKDFTGSFLVGAILIAGLSLARAVMALLLKIKPVSDTQASS